MKNICLYFEIHQPLRLRRYRFFDIGAEHYYYDDFLTEDRIRDLTLRSYVPASEALLDIIRASDGRFRCAVSISGIAVELLEQYAPEALEALQNIAKTNCVEFLAEPYAHSLSALYDQNEFQQQVKTHASKMEQLFGKKPLTLRNAELIYSDEIGEIAAAMGFKAMLMDEAKHIMGWKSPNYVYQHAHLSKLKLLVRNFKLSDDLSFRFSDRTWTNYPLRAERYLDWINATPEGENIINIWMGYEALGIYNNAESGIFDFLKALPLFAAERGIGFVTPAEAAKLEAKGGALLVPHPMSWAGSEKDLTPWTGNDLQQEALGKLYAVSERVRLCNDKALKHDWLMLQSSDHFRYMSHNDAFGSNYENPYEAFTNYMNVLADFLQRVEEQYPTTVENEELNELLTTITNQEKEIETLEEEIKKLRKRSSKTHTSKKT